MSKETKKVLEMLVAGQITADDAEKLLEKLGASGPGAAAPGAPEDASEAADKTVQERVRDAGERVQGAAEDKSSQRVWGWKFSSRDEAAASGQKLRFLRIVVDKPGDDQVNIRVPLPFLRAGMKLLGVIPPPVSERLAEKGIHIAALSDLKGAELVDELKDLHVDVDNKNGEKVRIYCE